MSLITVFLNSSATIAVSDKRISNRANIVSEDFRKVCNINEWLIFGSTGNAELHERIQNSLLSISHQTDNINNFAMYDDYISTFLKSNLMNTRDVEGNLVEQAIVLTGKDSENNIFLKTYTNLNQEYKEVFYQPSESEMFFITLTPPGLKMNLVNEFQILMEENKPTGFQGVINLQKVLQHRVADIDNSVNKVSDVLYITK